MTKIDQNAETELETHVFDYVDETNAGLKTSMVWIRAAGLKSKEEQEVFIQQLKANTLIWKALKNMLKQRYLSKKGETIDFTDPIIKDKILYLEGYKKCLIDLYQIIP